MDLLSSFKDCKGGMTSDNVGFIAIILFIHDMIDEVEERHRSGAVHRALVGHVSRAGWVCRWASRKLRWQWEMNKSQPAVLMGKSLTGIHAWSSCFKSSYTPDDTEVDCSSCEIRVWGVWCCKVNWFSGVLDLQCFFIGVNIPAKDLKQDQENVRYIICDDIWIVRACSD